MPTDPKETDGFASPSAVDKLVPERATEVVIAEMVAREPHKHGVTIDVRKRLAALRALQAGTDNWQYVYEEHCRAYGLDPEELMQGNRPRFTMGDDGEIKDHETGVIYGAKQPVEEAPADSSIAAEPLPVAGRGAGVERADHQDAAHQPAKPRGAASAGGIHVDGPIPIVGTPIEHRGVSAPVPGCEHSFPDPVEAATVCTSCGITFETWANQ